MYMLYGNNYRQAYLQDCVRITNEILYVLYGLVFDWSSIHLQNSISNV